MIIIRGLLLFAMVLIVCLQAPPVQSATYYISPTGSDANPGTSARPWLTFAYAISQTRATCGDTLVLKDGTYGDDTSTGKISITSLACTAGNELKLTAENQRQAKIFDNGTGRAVKISNSSYINLDGLYARSTDNSAAVNSGQGEPFRVEGSHHIQAKNILGVNPNRYANSHIIDVFESQDILVEDFEGYVFHRHCTMGFKSERMVVRRAYCNPRGGRIPGGQGLDQGAAGTAGAVMSFYPCRDCILENSIGDGTTTPMQFAEMNATFNGSMLMSGSKILGSVCYKCNAGNGIYLNARRVADLNHTPQNNTIRDVAIVDFNSRSAGIRVSNGVNNTLDHITVLGGGSGVTGILADDTAVGSTPATNSITMSNILVAGMMGTGFQVVGHLTWNGNKLFSDGNRSAFDPSLAPNWTNTSTRAHGMGTCKVWVPTGATIKGAGTGGSDIGANILYRYVNGVLTSTPLWDPRTGEFPHGAPDLDGTNRVEGQSLFDIHRRLNVNTGGCPFPRNYGDSDTSLPAPPVGLRTS